MSLKISNVQFLSSKQPIIAPKRLAAHHELTVAQIQSCLLKLLPLKLKSVIRHPANCDLAECYCYTLTHWSYYALMLVSTAR